MPENVDYYCDHNKNDVAGQDGTEGRHAAADEVSDKPVLVSRPASEEELQYAQVQGNEIVSDLLKNFCHLLVQTIRNGSC